DREFRGDAVDLHTVDILAADRAGWIRDRAHLCGSGRLGSDRHVVLRAARGWRKGKGARPRVEAHVVGAVVLKYQSRSCKVAHGSPDGEVAGAGAHDDSRDIGAADCAGWTADRAGLGRIARLTANSDVVAGAARAALLKLEGAVAIHWQVIAAVVAQHESAAEQSSHAAADRKRVDRASN